MAELAARTDSSEEVALMGAIRAEREAQSAPAPAEAAPAAEDTPIEAEAQPEPAEAAEATEGAEEAPEATEDAGDEAEAIELSKLMDLAEYVGTDEASIYGLTVPITVDGKAVDVPLGDLKDSYHSTAEAKRMQAEAKTFREQAEAKAKESAAQYEGQLAQGQALVQALEQAAMARFQGIDWNELRQTDPSEWSAKRMEVQQAAQQLSQVKAHVGEQLKTYKEQSNAQREAAYDEFLSKERVALDASWPELADSEKGEAERAGLIAEFKSRGFTDEEIGNAADHRVILMARDAKRYRESVKQTDAARKKVVKIQKTVLKPGAATAKADRSNNAINRAAAALKKSGSHRDFAKWLGEARRQR